MSFLAFLSLALSSRCVANMYRGFAIDVGYQDYWTGVHDSKKRSFLLCRTGFLFAAQIKLPPL
jgi:hypothetical protein